MNEDRSAIFIRRDDLKDQAVIALLRVHLEHSILHSPPGSMHALDPMALKSPDITLWTAWEDTDLLGCGALSELDPHHGEIKAMHTAERFRGRGVAAAILQTIIAEARARAYLTLSLETGSMDGFAAARALYARFGFIECPAFGSYVPDPASTFMTLALSPN